MPATLTLTPGAATASGVTTAIAAAVTLTLAAQAVAVRADATIVVTAATLLLTAQGVTAGGAGIIPYHTYVAGQRSSTFVAGKR
jgi:phage baseplate assembly protein gpV